MRGRDLKFAVGLDSTVDALRAAWRDEAFEEAAQACERRHVSLKAEGNTWAALEAEKCAMRIRALKDKP